VLFVDEMALSFGVGQRFFHGLCPVTREPRPTLVCPDCQLIAYRDEKAAHEDRPQHEPLCKVIRKLKLLSGGKHPLDGGSSAAIQVAQIAKICIKRSLTQFESDVLTYPRCCGTCWKFDTDFTMPYCPDCSCTVYCNEACKSEDAFHKNECQQIQMARNNWIEAAEEPAPGPVDLTETLPEDGAWCGESTTQAAVASVCGEQTRLNHKGCVLSGMLSTVLTIKMALQFASYEKKVCLHLVGARNMELVNIKLWQQLAEYEGLETLRLILVGPELVGHQGETKHDRVEVACVGGCLYEEYARSQAYQEPNLVVALNCGFILYNSWAASIPWMLRKDGCPMVFTEYYLSDAQDNLDLVFETINERSPDDTVQVLLPAEENPYRSLMPERCPTLLWGRVALRMQKKKIVYDNGHVCIVRRAAV